MPDDSNTKTSIEDLYGMNNFDFKRNRIYTQSVIYSLCIRNGMRSNVTTLPGLAFVRMLTLLQQITKGIVYDINFVEYNWDVYEEMARRDELLREATNNQLIRNYKLIFADAIDTKKAPVSRFEDLDTCCTLDTVEKLLKKRFFIQRESFSDKDWKCFMFSVQETSRRDNQWDRIQFIQNDILKPIGARLRLYDADKTTQILGEANEYRCNKSTQLGSWAFGYRLDFIEKGRVEDARLFRFSEGRKPDAGVFDPKPNSYPIMTFAVLYK